MENKNEFKENLIKMANSNKNHNTEKHKQDKNQMTKIGDNARKIIEIMKRGEKEDGR